MKDQAGYDGNVLVRVSTRITSHRADKHTLRCRPGDFSWKHARNKQSALYHAGTHFCVLWEQAGVALSSSANFLRGIKSGYATGISEARMHALQKLADIVTELGRFSTERLIDYCVLGYTTAEIASKHSQTEREISAALQQDLRSLALHLNYM